MAMSRNLWNKKCKCPACGGEFEATRLRTSSIKVKSRESDFGSLYEAECAYFYAVTACPHCTYAARNEHFDDLRLEYEAKIREACQKLKALPADRKPGIFEPGELGAEAAVKRHELAIAFARMRFHPDLSDLAGLHMHLVWIHRFTGQAEKERQAMEAAAKAYEEFFLKGHKLPEKLGEPGVLYLIGELKRRLGQFREARQFFEKALASREIKSFPNIESMTRDRMLEAKEQMEKVQGTLPAA